MVVLIIVTTLLVLSGCTQHEAALQGKIEAHIDLQQHFHHEIYLSDPRKTARDKLKTVIRYPIKVSLTTPTNH